MEPFRQEIEKINIYEEGLQERSPLLFKSENGMLHRYWIEFTGPPEDIWPCQMGCGVTGYHEEDALRLIQERIFPVKPMPPIQEIITDIDVSTLDANHILPNMGVSLRRGIWFPMGFE